MNRVIGVKEAVLTVRNWQAFGR